MIAGLLRLLVLGVIATIIDRLLATRSTEPEPIHSMVVIDAPIERVWDVLADIERQPEWMDEMKSVRMDTPPPVGVGSRGEATVRILGISVTDPVTITEFEPPHRFGVRHEGLFTGDGRITLEPGVDGSTTVVRWEETLIPPFLPHLGSVIQHPILAGIFQQDLHNLRALLER
jgi:uncharacterized protein YndB with AHSA1/START domain